MQLAIFDAFRLGVLDDAGQSIVDVTEALPWPVDADPVGAGWWVRLCRDFDRLRAPLFEAARSGDRRPVETVRLRAPVLNPGKVVACAINYSAHRAEMSDRVREAWLLEFDVFLKAPSSIVGPSDAVILPTGPTTDGREVHHESELTFVIGGEGGSNIAEADAMRHVLGYTIGIDVTLRGDGDRSRRKSYDTFTPLGPWLTTADDVPHPDALDIRLTIGDVLRQEANTRDLLMPIPGIVAYASSIMRLNPGDVILTGAPPGVGAIHAGDVIDATITGLGRLRVPVVSGTLSG